MKAFLVILLLALATSKFPDDIIELVQCVLKNEKIKEVVPKVLVALKNGDFASPISIAFTSFPQIKKEIEECMYSEPVLEASTCLQLKLYQVCSRQCGDWRKDPQCDLDCQKKYCFLNRK